MSYRNDPTANVAIGNVNREWKRMVRLAIRLLESGDLSRMDRERLRFTGIYRHLLDQPIERLRAMLSESPKEGGPAPRDSAA